MKLTAKQVKDLCEAGVVDDAEDSTSAVPRHTVQLVKLMKSIRSSTPEGLAHYLIEQEQDAEVARARLQSLRRLIMKQNSTYNEKGRHVATFCEEDFNA